MQQNPEVKKDVTNRLRSVRGHLDGILRMVENDEYCIDVINQVQAVQSALNKVNLLVLDDHMHSCVTEAIRGQDATERERVLGEIKHVFAKRSKL
ncbi:MAG: metal-sensitive transcriptional regulator [Anaerolineales bacterium]